HGDPVVVGRVAVMRQRGRALSNQKTNNHHGRHERMSFHLSYLVTLILIRTSNWAAGLDAWDRDVSNSSLYPFVQYVGAVVTDVAGHQIHRGGAGFANRAASIAAFGCTDATLIVD